MPETFKELDVRPILRGGGEPFPAIMEAVGSLAPGQGLRLLATFRPDPLFAVMARRGYSGRAKEIGDGDWEVSFTPRQDDVAAVSVSTGAEEAGTWPEPLWQLDLTSLEPPAPMEKVISRVELMDPGEVLFALFAREPIFLPPELEKRGHQWVGNYDERGSAYRMLIRIGDGRGR